MNKRTMMTLYWTAVIIILTFFFASRITWEEQFFEVGVSANTCVHLFECTPAEFVEGKYLAYEEWKDLIKDVRLDEGGRAVFRYSKKNGYKLRETRFLNEFPELSNVSEIELSEDRRTITIWLPLENRTLEELENIINDKLVYRLYFWRGFSGVSFDENYTIVVLKNRETGEILSSERIFVESIPSE